LVGKPRTTASGMLGHAFAKAVSGDLADRDPFDEMWSAANMEHLRPFDQNLLTTIYNKPYKELKHQAALAGSGIMGLLSMPFGPMGMAAGGFFGAVCGGIVGFCADRRRKRLRIEGSAIAKKRLRSLVRWATERLGEDDENSFKLIEMVTLEFHPLTLIADQSQSARKQLKLLDKWVAEKSVNRQLWAYMDNMLRRWQELSRKEFVRSMTVFQTLTTMYNYTTRALDEQETQLIMHMNRLLEHPSVKSVMTQAQQFPEIQDRNVMESMVFADHVKVRRAAREEQRPGNLADDAARTGAASDDSDDDKPCAANVDGVEAEISKPAARTLKKPFFKSWDDFMDFDAGFKRKMPITLSEFNLVLEKEKEPNTNWDVCVDRKEIRVAKMMIGTGCITLRAWATVPGVRRDVAFYLFHKHEERMRWDKVFTNMCNIGPPQNGSEVLYSFMKLTGVTPRDFLQYRRVRILEDGTIIIVLRSAEHPDCPENKNAIRAESYIGGYVIREEYENGQPVLKLFLMTCSDVKGLIPKWIINFVAPKKPAEWMDSLRKVCMDYQEANPNCDEFLQNYIAPFKEEEPWDYEHPPSEYEEDSPRGALLLPNDEDCKLTL